MNKKIFIIIFLSLFLFSCSKNIENTSNKINLEKEEKITISTWKIENSTEKNFEKKWDLIIFQDKKNFFEISFSKYFDYSKIKNTEDIIFTDTISWENFSITTFENKFSDLDSYLKDYLEKVKNFWYYEISKNDFEINWQKWFKINYSSNIWEVEIFSEQYFFENKNKKIILISFSNTEKNINNIIIKTFKLLK